jgi:nitrate/TMAO reductase-like tetraheme cytochrome c subunit
MDFHEQTRRAQEKMQEGLKKGKTCITCHKGIAHQLPENF